MNILILEDDLYTASMLSFNLQEQLQNKISPLEIVECISIYEADEAIKDTEYDFIVCDLNMNPDGLPEEYINETLGAVITGWVWCYYNIFKMSKDSLIIFYSDFIDILKSTDKFDIYKEQSVALSKSEHDVEDICEIIIENYKRKLS